MIFALHQIRVRSSLGIKIRSTGMALPIPAALTLPVKSRTLEEKVPDTVSHTVCQEESLCLASSADRLGQNRQFRIAQWPPQTMDSAGGEEPPVA
jgi:hypothetical protein